MQEAIDEYFDSLDGELPTITGLALALDFDSRAGLLYYQDEKPEFLATIKRAKGRVEEAMERELINRNGSVTGLIFNLKNNFAWKDAQELNHTGADGVPLSLRVEFVNRSDT
jgi:hypothetical protein